MLMDVKEGNRKKAMVVDYLNESGIKPTLKGYRIFMDIIPLSAEEPELTCYELFDKYNCILYGNETSMRVKKASWNTLYRDCKYALSNSKSDTAAVFDFIRSCAIKLEVTDES
jgi:hypothetical protein